MKNKVIKGVVIAAGVIAGALLGRKIVSTIRTRNLHIEESAE